jgi:hypothetical protein
MLARAEAQAAAMRLGLALERVDQADDGGLVGEDRHHVGAETRRLGTMLLTQTMNRRPENGFKSYDRLFPSPITGTVDPAGHAASLPNRCSTGDIDQLQ